MTKSEQLSVALATPLTSPSFDLELPIECDDEYWLTPEGKPLFKQPLEKPSKVSAFVYSIRLGQILAFALRTIVSHFTSVSPDSD